MINQQPSVQRIFQQFFAQGGMTAVNQALGHPFALEGVIVHGQHLGRTVGMPTANLRPAPQSFLPPYGVYATLLWVGGEAHEGITHVGPRPSVGENQVTVETFLFRFEGDLYGQQVRLEFYGFIREICKMNGLAAVRYQVEQDAILARQILKEVPPV